ncbi:MAG: flagellar basal body rod C-terminal domain-containing protein [Pseudolabrys sp.]
MAQALNNATNNIQALRSQADQGIANDVQQANIALTQIANINQQLATAAPNDSSKALLENQRDQYIDQLSKLMDIRVVQGAHDQISVFTTSGTQLVSTQAAQLQFNATGSFNAGLQWNADPSKSTLGTISLIGPAGGSVDLIANGSIRSGEIAAYLNMRDNTLVQAQTQVDAIATHLASSLSDTDTSASATSMGLQNGFLADTSGMQTGNTVHVTYTDSSNVKHNVSIVRVDDPSVLPLSNASTVDPNDTVVGVDFSGGMASVITQLNTALGATGLQFSNPSGSILQVLDSGPGTITVNSVSTTTTATSLTSGGASLPFFMDGSSAYSGATTSIGAESVGFAGRISVNSALIGDPTKLITYNLSPQTPVGDSTRPNYIYNQLMNVAQTYSPDTGVGGVSSSFQGTLSSFLSQIISKQSIAANAASNLKDGQDIVVNALQARFNSASAVSIDTEMAHLLQLQNSYGANARVMSTVKAMLDSLMQVL